VADRDRDVGPGLRGTGVVDPPDLGIHERQELRLVGAEEVGGPGAVALARELEGPLDDVAAGLDPDAFAAQRQALSIGQGAEGL
jgi:hypothetical protein